MKDLKVIPRSILNSYSGVLFIAHPGAGLVILFLTLIYPNLGLSALVCTLSAYTFARFLGLKEDFLRLDFYTYNPLLVGLSIGYYFKICCLSLLFLVLMGIFTFVLTYATYNFFSYYLRLPILSLPFVAGSLLAALASYKYSNLFVVSLYPRFQLPAWEFPIPLAGFFKALGAIFFLPYPLVGLILFLLLLWFSPILGFLALAGYIFGSLLAALFVGSLEASFSHLGHFNFVLIAMALGGVFLLPSLRSYLLALVAVGVASPLSEASQVFWQKFGLPAFALPFNLVTLLFLYSLRLAGYPRLAFYYRGTPERTLDYHLSLDRRFPFGVWVIEWPLSGKWTVWQGTNGKFTHQGPWRYALDFVVQDEAGRTFEGSGRVLEDYYAYRKPVFSPVSGRVVELVDELPDEPPGSANTERPWGNYILIYDSRGFYVLMAHFSPGTFQVKKGDWVVEGTLLGLCGSSGYAPQPHLHLHIQGSPELGAPTMPFVFKAYQSEGRFWDFQLPKEGETVEALPPDKRLKQSLNFLLGETFSYEIYQNQTLKETLDLRVEMAPDGTFYLTEGKGKLYFGWRGGAFYFLNYQGPGNSSLKDLFLAAPKIPLGLREGLKWEDFLPLELLLPWWQKNAYLFLGSFWPRALDFKGQYQALSKFDFEGQICFNKKEVKTRVKLCQVKGFKEVEIQKGNQIYLWRRKDHEEKGV